MEFHLTYRGELRSNGDIAHKHDIRSKLHFQLARLWTHPPLAGHFTDLQQNRANACVDFLRTVTGWTNFTFAPLVNDKVHLMCQLDITLLRPEPPGKLVTQSGDIDNRLKTLFDAFRMPKDVGEMPKSISPLADGDYFFCLLEDDNLISRVNVNTDWLLEDTSSPSEVLLLIKVKTWLVKPTTDYTDLGV